MKTRALLGSLICLALLAAFSGDNARVSADPMPPQYTVETGVLQNVVIRPRTSTVALEQPDVDITKRVVGSGFMPGDSITFTLTIANSGSEVAAHVVVTELPS